MSSEKSISKFKRFGIDVIINMVGTALPLLLLQMIIYPLVAKSISADLYGEMQTTISVVYLSGGVLGTALSTSRLIKNADESYNDCDYSFLSFISIVTLTLMSFLFFVLYFSDTQIHLLIFRIIIVIESYLINYLEVEFRIKLNFKNILYSNLYGCVGAIAGYGVFFLTNIWEFILVGTYLFRVVFCLLNTSIWKEKKIRSPLFKERSLTFFHLTTSNLLDKSIVYLDRLLLFSLLGGAAVSVYYTANIIVKLALKVIAPINNVILSYLAKGKTVRREIWKTTLVVGVGSCVIMYPVCIAINKFLLPIFYGQWSSEAIVLVPITSASLCVSVLNGFLAPLSLKSLATNRQVIISFFSLLMYVCVFLLTYKRFGLGGCCFASLLGYLTKTVLMLLFYFVSLKQNKISTS